MPSTAIRSYRYDPTLRELSIVFPSMRRYTYIDVPAETYTGLKAAPSKGEFFSRHIRDRFTFRREEEEALPRPRYSAGTPRPRRDRMPLQQSPHSHRGGRG